MNYMTTYELIEALDTDVYRFYQLRNAGIIPMPDHARKNRKTKVYSPGLAAKIIKSAGKNCTKIWDSTKAQRMQARRKGEI